MHKTLINKKQKATHAIVQYKMHDKLLQLLQNDIAIMLIESFLVLLDFDFYQQSIPNSKCVHISCKIKMCAVKL